MKNIFKKVVEKKLRAYAADIIAKYHPDIIGITGSVGKTSAKEAVFTVLKDRMNVRKSEKNYNNEIGVPLTIIGAETGKSSPREWIKVFMRAKQALGNTHEYPKIIIAEMGADRPGDIQYLMSFIPCTIGVITALSEAHLEHFKTPDALMREKRKIIEALPKNGHAIINGDDPKIREMALHTKARIITFGFSEHNDIRAAEVKVMRNANNGHNTNNGFGTAFKLMYANSVIPVFLPGALGEHFVYSALIAIAIGGIYEIPVMEMVNALKFFRAPAGRMRPVVGIKGTTIIDDTYNSSPKAVIAALKVLAVLDAPRKIVVLGDMLELGATSEQEHYNAGKIIQDFGINILITVGERARDIARGAKDFGLPKSSIFSFSKSDEAGRFLQDRIESGDLILVKGSQGVRMEKIVKEIMADPQRAKELLARQTDEWIQK